MRTNLIIVHGEKSLRNGNIHPAFRERLDEALRVANQGDYQGVLITGGYTRAGVISEAEMGKQYLQGKTNLPIHLEDKSHTTIENVTFTHLHEEGHHEKINQAVVITSKVRIPRVRFLYRRLWPKLYSRLTFIGTKNHYFPLYFLLERAYWLFDILDPRERFIIQWAKYLFRNT